MITARAGAGLLILTVGVMPSMAARSASAASAAEINRDAGAALDKLYAAVPEARTLGSKARAILIFPKITKAGFMFGAQYGDGLLRRQGKPVGYYNTVAASYGFQAGIQQFGYVLFFMTDGAREYLNKSGGFEVGVGPSIVVLDSGTAKSMTTTTMQHDIYAMIFAQKGLMGGAGLQGTKISRIEK